MISIPFDKYHGNGNDFVFFSWDLLEEFQNIEKLCQKAPLWCHRHKGVGADGLFVYKWLPAQRRVLAIIINADGSRASTCGNALRCLGLLLIHKGLWDGNDSLSVCSLDNVDLCFATLLSYQPAQGVRVDMGIVQSVRPLIFPLEKKFSPKAIDLKTGSVFFVQLANPHLVFISNDFASFSRTDFIEFGNWAQSAGLKELSSAFDIPVSNISMVFQDAKGNWHVTVYERGAGLTLCCGSGATAVRLALEQKESSLKAQMDLKLKLLGGELWVSRQGEQLILSGDSVFVYSGILSQYLL